MTTSQFKIDVPDGEYTGIWSNNVVHFSIYGYKKPLNLILLENQLEEVRQRKIVLVKQQIYSEAAQHREVERKLIKDLEAAKTVWSNVLNENNISFTTIDRNPGLVSSCNIKIDDGIETVKLKY